MRFYCGVQDKSRLMPDHLSPSPALDTRDRERMALPGQLHTPWIAPMPIARQLAAFFRAERGPAKVRPAPSKSSCSRINPNGIRPWIQASLLFTSRTSYCSGPITRAGPNRFAFLLLGLDFRIPIIVAPFLVHNVE